MEVEEKHHPQLRSLFSSPSPDLFYYVFDHDLYRLDVLGRKRELVTSLGFSARCMAASYGWVCVGGADNGQFAAIRTEDDAAQRRERSPSRSPDVDELLSLDILPEVRRHAHRYLFGLDVRPGSTSRRKAEARVHEFGGMITNSVTIHQPPRGSRGVEDGPVAVLTNNDKTVRTFSLPRDRLLDTLEFPIQMNHATIRPDGEMLVAVGDEAYAYFYRRLAVKTPTVRGVFDRRSNHPAWRWELQARFDLPRAPDPADNGLFATAFSSSGRHCAVASQDGIITVFDTGAIRDSTSSHTAIVATLSSSRPHSRTGEGAIRSICFSPSPWDLLICVEQSGRACVYDLRSGFRMRQPVDLCPQSVGVQRVEIHDESAAAEDMIDPRLRQSTDMEHIRQYRDSLAMRDEAAAAEFATDYMESAGDRRRLLRPVRHDSPQATTERERQVLDALRTSHERVEARDQGLNYRPARELRDPPSLQSDAEMIGPFLSGSSSGTTPPRRDRLRDRNPDRDSTRARPYEPHRRDSVVITDDHRNVGDTVYDLITGVRTSATSTSHPRTSRLDPWQALEGEVQLRQERETGRGSIWSNRQYLTALMELERRNARRLVESRRREHIRSVYTEMVRTGRQDDPPPRRDSENHGGTTGCAMSGDGRKLYVGTDEGIFEVHINLQQGMYFPQISPR